MGLMSGIPVDDDAQVRMLEADKVQAKAAAVKAAGDQVVADESAQAGESAEGLPFALEAKKEKTKTHLAENVQKTIATRGAYILPPEEIDGSAKEFARDRRNPEIDAEKLAKLGKKIEVGDSKEVVLQKVRVDYPDPFLASEALEFLVVMAENTPMADTIKAARDEFAASNRQQIDAGKNTQKVTLAAVDKGLGTPEELRHTYQEYTISDADTQTLCEELIKEYGNDFGKIKEHTLFLLHSLGADIKPALKTVVGNDLQVMHSSLDAEKLRALIGKTKSCQAILGVYRFFNGRMGLVVKLFKKEELPMPAQLTFENMSKQFMTLVADRSLSALKVGQLAPKLGVENSVEGQIIVFSQMRDGVPNVSLLLFKSGPQREDAIQRRNDCLAAIIEWLESLEEQLEVKEEDSANTEKL